MRPKNSRQTIPILALALAALVAPARATTVFNSQASLETSTPLLNFTAPFDFSTVLCGGISCAGQSGLSSMTVNLAGIGDVIFSITGNTFSVTNNSIVTSGGNGTTLSVSLPVLVLAFGSSIAPSSG